MSSWKVGRPVWVEGSSVFALDQRLLPHAEEIRRFDSYRETVEAIRNMTVRGAGTIGVAGGYATAQAALAASASGFWHEMEEAAALIRAARPTAKNLSYAVDRVIAAMHEESSIDLARQRAKAEAQAIEEDDRRLTERIAHAAVHLIPTKKAVLTHCNAGWLAYPGWGTALGPLYLAHRQGRLVFVYATETRPRSQGAKLTTWELTQAKIPHALIADTAAGYTMAKGRIGMVIVGADRIAANGDTANKIGTYTLAVLAKAHEIPFYVAAPSPTFDAECSSGAQIPIEERDEAEVLEVSGVSMTGQPAAVRITGAREVARNPAFDVTPAELITGFITETGIVVPNSQAIRRFLASAIEGRRSAIPVGSPPSSREHPTTESIG